MSANQFKFGGIAVLQVAASDARIIRTHPSRIESLVKCAVLRRMVMVLRTSLPHMWNLEEQEHYPSDEERPKGRLYDAADLANDSPGIS
jgi:hypothetical protein